MPKANSAPNVDIFAEVSLATKALGPAVKRLSKALGALDPARLPMGAAADLLYDLNATSKLLSTLSAPFDDCIGPAVKALQDYFIASLKVGEASGVQGMSSRVQITESPIPVIKAEDWDKFYAYVAKTKQWDLLGRAINREAVRERWKLKKQVKFVGTFVAKKVSCTTLGAAKRAKRKEAE